MPISWYVSASRYCSAAASSDEAPAPTPDAGRALLYDLAKTLESVGEHSRALAVFVELESESGGYRDVAGQIERLSKARG